MDRLDPNDVAFAEVRAASAILHGRPCPRGEGGAIHPHVSRFWLADGRLMDVVHVKPVYYETPAGAWRPLSEVCSHHGNRHIAIRPDRVSWVHPRFLLWLMNRQHLLGSELAFWSEGYAGVQPRHLEFATTLTVYPDPDPETTTVDGEVNHNGLFATAQPATDGIAAQPSDTTMRVRGGASLICRLFMLFDTSALGASATSISGVLSLRPNGAGSKSNGDDDGDDWLNVVQSNPASNTNLTTADYDQCGSAISNPTEGATRIDFGSIVETAYNDWTLNGTGNGWINSTGVTKLGLREGHDCINSAAASTNAVLMRAADNSGTGSDPKLVVTYTIPVTPLSALASSSPAALRTAQTGKIARATSSPLGSRTSQTSKIARATTSPLAPASRAIGKLVLATTTPTKAAVRAVGKLALAITTPTKSATRAVGKLALANSTPAKALTISTLIIRRATSAPLATASRIVGLIRTALTAPVASRVAAVGAVRQVSTSPIASMDADRVSLVSALADAAVSAGLGKVAAKVLGADVVALAAARRDVAKGLAVEAAAAAALTRSTTKAGAAQSAPVAGLTATVLHMLALTAEAYGVASLGRVTAKGLRATAGGVATLTAAATRSVSALVSAAVAASLSRMAGRTARGQTAPVASASLFTRLARDVRRVAVFFTFWR